jgi:uncharacterized protein (DUF305 family)
MKVQIKGMRAHALAFAAAFAVAVFTLAAGGSVMAQGHTGHTGQQPQQHTGHMQPGDMTPGLHFIDMTMMHHRQGIEMARLAEEKSQNARVKAFATKTITAQENDLKQLQFLRDTHYSGRPAMSHEQMMSHMQGMPGHEGMKMDMEGDMNKLRAATGRAFDRLFLDTMTHHHQMAVQMSKDAAAGAEFSDIKEFARRGAQMQQAEIAEMNRIKASLGGSTARRATAKAKPKPKAKAKATTTHKHEH